MLRVDFLPGAGAGISLSPTLGAGHESHPSPGAGSSPTPPAHPKPPGHPQGRARSCSRAPLHPGAGGRTKGWQLQLYFCATRVADGAAFVPPTLPVFNYSPEIAVTYGQLLLQHAGTTRENKNRFLSPFPSGKNFINGGRPFREGGSVRFVFYPVVFFPPPT